jgi:hypothetical protein
MYAFTGRNRFILIDSPWKHSKNSKTTRDAYLGQHISDYIKNSSIHLVTGGGANETIGENGFCRRKAGWKVSMSENSTGGGIRYALFYNLLESSRIKDKLN